MMREQVMEDMSLITTRLRRAMGPNGEQLSDMLNERAGQQQVEGVLEILRFIAGDPRISNSLNMSQHMQRLRTNLGDVVQAMPRRPRLEN